MNLPNKPPAARTPAHPPADPVAVVSVPKMQKLLDEAAQLAAGAGLPPEAFAGVAWHAYLRSVPGIAEQLAEAQLDASLEELRRNGRLAKA